MSKTGEIPYTWPQIEEQIKEAILCQASILEEFGPVRTRNLVADYLGIDPEEFSDKTVEDIRDVDISKHGIYFHARIAYDYAYQLNPVELHLAQSSWHSVDGLLQGFPETDAAGEPSPFCRLNDFPLRRMLETFFARFGLFEESLSIDYMPSIRELSLLANMTIPAVRTSLSKESFKLEKSHGVTRGNQEESGFRLNTQDAKLWLSRRRGFIPQRTDTEGEQADRAIAQILEDADLLFPDALKRVIGLRKLEVDAIAAAAAIDKVWLVDLTEGKSVSPDLTALKAVARALSVPAPDFVAAGVRHLLRLEAGSA